MGGVWTSLPAKACRFCIYLINRCRIPSVSTTLIWNWLFRIFCNLKHSIIQSLTPLFPTFSWLRLGVSVYFIADAGSPLEAASPERPVAASCCRCYVCFNMPSKSNVASLLLTTVLGSYLLLFCISLCNIFDYWLSNDAYDSNLTSWWLILARKP